jgi:hypothetical protein
MQDGGGEEGGEGVGRKQKKEEDAEEDDWVKVGDEADAIEAEERQPMPLPKDALLKLVDLVMPCVFDLRPPQAVVARAAAREQVQVVQEQKLAAAVAVHIPLQEEGNAGTSVRTVNAHRVAFSNTSEMTVAKQLSSSAFTFDTPVIFLRGARGSGKRSLVRRASEICGLQLLEIGYHELLAPTLDQSIERWRSRIEAARSKSAPVLVHVWWFTWSGGSSAGSGAGGPEPFEELRFISAIQQALTGRAPTAQSTASSAGQKPADSFARAAEFSEQEALAAERPVVLVCSGVDTEGLGKTISAMFSHELHVTAPEQAQREDILTFMCRNVALDVRGFEDSSEGDSADIYSEGGEAGDFTESTDGARRRMMADLAKHTAGRQAGELAVLVANAGVKAVIRELEAHATWEDSKNGSSTDGADSAVETSVDGLVIGQHLLKDDDDELEGDHFDLFATVAIPEADSAGATVSAFRLQTRSIEQCAEERKGVSATSGNQLALGSQHSRQCANEQGLFRISKVDFDNALSELKTPATLGMSVPTIPNVKWDDVGGLGDVKKEVGLL